MTPAEHQLIERLILESAIERTKEHVARLQRRADHVYGEWHYAVKVLEQMEARAKEMRK